jgi:hypothetical protein
MLSVIKNIFYLSGQPLKEAGFDCEPNQIAAAVQ